MASYHNKQRWVNLQNQIYEAFELLVVEKLIPHILKNMANGPVIKTFGETDDMEIIEQAPKCFEIRSSNPVIILMGSILEFISV